jgi:hypothetical protein
MTINLYKSIGLVDRLLDTNYTAELLKELYA